MRRRHLDITFVFSLCCSLIINSGMVGVVILRTQPPAVVDLRRWHASPRPAAAAAPAPVAQDLPPPPEQQTPPQPKVEFDDREVFGENGGVGQALNSAPGDQPMLAQLSPQVQAFLGRNPPRSPGGGGGNAGQGGGASPTLIGAAGPTQAAAPHVQPPQPQIKPAPQQPRAQPPAQPHPSTPAAPPQQTPPSQKQPDQSPALAEQTPQPQPPRAQPTPPQAVPTPPPPPPPTVQVAQNTPTEKAQPGKPGKPGAPAPPGPPGPPNSTADTAPPSDQDSDPFSDTNSFRFVNGKVQARNGRWVKPVRPHFNDAGSVDSELMGNPSVTFLATVDEQGHVIDVRRFRSSGSDNIDLPCQQALYLWQIEPSKDKKGHPMKDLLSITFAFY